MAVVCEARGWWPVHLEQNLSLWLWGQDTESTLHERVGQDQTTCQSHGKMGWVHERSSPAL